MDENEPSDPTAALYARLTRQVRQQQQREKDDTERAIPASLRRNANP